MRPLILILLVLSFNTASANPPPESFDKMNTSFPDITFVSPEGKTSKLSEYKGKVVVVKLPPVSGYLSPLKIIYLS